MVAAAKNLKLPTDDKVEEVTNIDTQASDGGYKSITHDGTF